MQQNRHGWLAVLTGCVLLTGCQGPGSHAMRTSLASERTPDLNTTQKADVLFAMARSLEKTGDIARASDIYQDVLRKDPRRADAIDRLAVIHARKEQFEQAVALHKKAIALQPGNADFHCNLGYCYYLQKHWTEAESQLQKAIELSSNHQRAHNNLGLVLAQTERNQQAFTEFRRAGCTEAEAHNNLAFVLTLSNSFTEAKAHYARARDLGLTSEATDNGLRAVNSLMREADVPDALQSVGKMPQDTPRPVMPPRVNVLPARELALGPPTAMQANQSAPTQVVGDQTPTVINLPRSHGPISVNAEGIAAEPAILNWPAPIVLITDGKVR